MDTALMYYEKIPAGHWSRELKQRWTVLEDGKPPRRFYSAEVALRCLESRKEREGRGLRFGWNLPAKKAQGCNPEPMEMAELIEKCGIREARKIMELES